MSAPSSVLDTKLEGDSITDSPRAPGSLKSNDASDSGNPVPPSDFNPNWRFVVAISSLSVITLMAALDATSLSVALPKIASLLHGTAIEAFWAGTSFLLTSTVFQPVMGSFSHIFGRKPLIMISLAFFVVGAIVAAVANNFTVLLVGRSIQGTGGGGIICLSEIVITDLVPLRERGKWFSFLSAMWALGTVAGPLLGGGFSQNVTWRWIFWINLPFAGVGTVLVVIFLSLSHKTTSFMTKLRRVDWIGMILFIASTTGFLIPITWGGVQYSWSSWRTLVPLIVCAMGLIAFILYEEFVATEPLIRTSVFKNRSAAITFLQDFIHGIVLWGILYYMPLYYEAVKGFSPIIAGVAMFPQCFTIAPAAMAVGAAVAISGRYRWAIWSGWFLTTFGLGLLIYLKVDTPTVSWIFLNLVSGLGTGVLFPSMAITVQACTTNEDQAYAVAMFSFLRAFGQTVGVAIGGTIFQNQMSKNLLSYPLLADKAAEYSADASGLVLIIKAMPAGEMKHQLLVSYTDSLKYIWIVLCALSGVALISSFFLQAFPLDRALETDQGFVDKSKPADVEKLAPNSQAQL